MKDLELAAIEKVNEALGAVKDDETRGRVLRWAIEKFGKSISKSSTEHQDALQLLENKSSECLKQIGDEIAGIAKLTKDGNIEMTVRDLKAKSRKDAALRFALVYIRAHEKLSGKQSVSSRRGLTPALKDRRLYDCNCRSLLANYAGIIRKKDELSLDTVARQDADKYMTEIVDSNSKGKWNTSKIGKRRKKKE